MDSFFCGSIGEQRSKPFWYDIPLKKSWSVYGDPYDGLWKNPHVKN